MRSCFADPCCDEGASILRWWRPTVKDLIDPSIPRRRVPQPYAAANSTPVVVETDSRRQALQLLRLPSAKHDVVRLHAGSQQHDDCVDVTCPFLSPEPLQAAQANVVLVRAAVAVRQMRELERHDNAL